MGIIANFELCSRLWTEILTQRSFDDYVKNIKNWDKWKKKILTLKLTLAESTKI